jgi:hypothetical protein
MELFTSEIAWLFFAYAVGTAFGWYMGTKNTVHNATEAVIDTLIEQKYIKTRGYGNDMEILKYTEWCDDKNSG